MVVETTVAAYAKAQAISISTARKRLNQLVERGFANVAHDVVIEQRSAKRGASSRMTSIRGTHYSITSQAAPAKPKSQRPPHIKMPCGECPFRKDSQEGWLGKERMDGILKVDSFVCHNAHDRQCAGHMLIRGNDNAFVRLANQLGITLELRGRELVFDKPEDCIEHHEW